MFVEKTSTELAAMDAAALGAYFKEKSAADRATIDALINAKASKADIDAAKAEIMGAQTKQIDALNEALKAQGIEIVRLSGNGGAAKEKSLREMLSEKAADLKSIKDGETKRVVIDVKAAGTMTITGNATGEVPQSQREPGLNRIARRRAFVADYINQGTTTSNAVSWVEQTNPDGSPAGTDEGATKNQIDFDLLVVTENVKKRTAFVKVSKEMLDDIDFMRSEIDTELMERLGLDVDSQMLSGDNIGANLNGMITQSTAFAAGSFAGTIEAANNYDVLLVAYNQIVTANFMPSTIFLNPTDMVGMQLTKGTDGHYITFPFVSPDGRRFNAIPVVENNGVPVGTFLIFDGSKAKAVVRENMTISIGYSNDDFTKNLVTILGEWRGLMLIKGNDTPAFVSGTFAAAKAALETP
jgi:HK97 family phage major capsid protein